ncbi:MAG: glycosyltransferase family 2 protein [Candidatus Paceibacterota bacterium]|jgi:glycosyltransferase involved in cell wall biosynthesis
MPPLVSVIIPTHNRNLSLKRAIQSVLDQTFTDYEIIVVDDTWATNEISDNYPNVHFLHIPTTSYPAISRNMGIKVSNGKYIAFLDDDDVWYPEKLASQISRLLIDPKLGLVCSNGNIGKDLYIKRNITNEPDMLPQEIIGDFVVTSSCVIRRSLLEKTGLYNLLPLCEDYDFSIRFVATTQIYYDPTPLFEYTISENSIQKRSNYSFVAYHQNVIKVMENLREFLKRNNLEKPETSFLIHYRILDEKIMVMWNIVKDFIRGY